MTNINAKFETRAKKLTYKLDSETFAKFLLQGAYSQFTDFIDDMLRAGAYNVEWGEHSNCRILFTVDWVKDKDEMDAKLKSIENCINNYTIGI